MAKKYIIVTMNIGGINGAEQYLYNKMNFAESKGYETIIFSGRPGKVLIQGFKKYEHLVNPVLRFYPYCLQKKELEKSIDWILSEIGQVDSKECIVESSNVTSALWGEIIAKRLGCKHLAIIMQEKHNYSSSMIDFLEFKSKQHELSGINQLSVGQMLKNPDVAFSPEMHVRAFCNNVVQDCEENISNLLDSSADINIGSIGRLEKDYVMPLILNFATYFKNNSDKKFNLVLIGGCADKRQLNRIKAIVSECDNVNLVLTGALYPIPKSLVKKMDFFVSAAGSSAVSYYQKVPTLRINHLSAEPMGIIGYDYKLGKPLEWDFSVGRSFENCLQLLLNNKKDMEFIENFDEYYILRMKTEFERHLNFGVEENFRKYYDVLTVKYADFKYKICSIFCKVIGIKNTYALLEKIRKLVRGNK